MDIQKCAIPASFLVCLVCWSPFGRGQDASDSSTQLSARAGAQARELTKTVGLDPRSVSVLGKGFATFLQTGAREVYIISAMAFPIDWLLHTEVVWPLVDQGLVPSYVSDVVAVSSPYDTVFVVLTYGKNDRPAGDGSEEERLVADRWFDANRLSGPLFENPSPASSARILILREYSSQADQTTASVVVRAAVRGERLGQVRELVVLEDWRLQTTSDRRETCWKRTRARHFFGQDQASQTADTLPPRSAPSNRATGIDQ